MKLDALLTAFRKVAPEHLAEDWDQVGVHLAGNGRPIKKALLCIDLTPAVLDEAIANKCQLIVAYHPPIFHPLKRLADRDWKEKMLAEAVRKGLAVYSPHTALDAVREGMNDWLCEGLGKHDYRYAIGPYTKPGHTYRYKIVVYTPRKDADRIRSVMAREGAGWIGGYDNCSFNIDGVGTFRGNDQSNPAIGIPGRLERVEETRVEMICRYEAMGDILKAVREAHPYEEPAIDILELAKEIPREIDEQAAGRLVDLSTPVSAQTLINRVKRCLNVKKIKASIPPDYGAGGKEMWNSHRVVQEKNDSFTPGKLGRIAVCVGAGGSLLENLPYADAYITGEMQHHQVLDLYQKGKVVILAGHTNTERPFLGRYRDRLIEEGGDKIEWLISAADRAPMAIM